MTPAFGGQYSIQLSYGRIFKVILNRRAELRVQARVPLFLAPSAHELRLRKPRLDPAELRAHFAATESPCRTGIVAATLFGDGC